MTVKGAFASSVAPSRASARDIAAVGSGGPVRFFAVLGAGWVALIGYVMFQWISAPYFGPTDPGPDVPPAYVIWCIRGLEATMSLITLWLFWECIIKPIKRTGEPTSDGLLAISWLTMWFQDIFLNWTVHVFSYNSHAINFGNWTAEVPGWVSPRSHLVPEPVFALGLSYIGQCTLGAWVAIGFMEKAKARWPQISNTSLVLIGLFTGMFLDWASEHTMISFQLMSYMSVVPELTLMPGSIYQFPLYEAFFFGGVIGFTGVVMYFKDDKGYTWAERGVDKLRISKSKGLKTLVRWLAMMGLFHTVLFFGYSLPMQLFSINGTAFPKDVPSYLLNGVCGEGTPYECAPDLMPRRRIEQNSEVVEE